jgi:hypothetical protein
VLQQARKQHYFLTYLHAEKLQIILQYTQGHLEDTDKLTHILCFINPNFKPYMLSESWGAENDKEIGYDDEIEISNDDEISEQNKPRDEFREVAGDVNPGYDESLLGVLCNLGEYLDRISF